MHAMEELRYLVLAVQREGNRWLAAHLRPLGVTPAQAEALRVLGDHAPLTLTGLGELLVCESGSSPSRLVDRLVAHGLVERHPDAHDRRSVNLALSAQGSELERRIVAVERRLYDHLELLTDDQPLDAALQVLRGIAAPSPAGHALTRRRGDT
jgi:DNA-binding MarR family transcriptional regulator